MTEEQAEQFIALLHSIERSLARIAELVDSAALAAAMDEEM